MTASETARATIYVGDDEHPSDDYSWIVNWLKQHKDRVEVAGYETGGWEHLWDVHGPADVIAEIPEGFLCSSTWTAKENGRWTAESSDLTGMFS